MATSSIKDLILEDMKTAMRAQDKDGLSTIRLILATLKQREVDERITLSDEQILLTLNKMIKQRRDSIAQFEAGGRADLAEKEAAEVRCIQRYLPSPLSDMELEALIAAAIQETNAASARDMGKVMAIIKTKAQGKADMTVVSAKVKARLG